MKNLRLSPSGPVVGPIGPNFQLRDDETVIALSALTLTNAAQEVDTDLRAELEAMADTSFYGVEAEFDLSNESTNVPATITGTLQISIDDGANWTTVATCTHVVGCSGVALGVGPMVRPVRLTMVPVALSTVTDFAGTLLARAQVLTADGQSTKVKNSAGGMAFITLTEYFNG